MSPLKPLLHLIGFKQVHQKVIQIISEALMVNAKHFKVFNIQSFDFYDQQNLAQIYIDSSKTDKGKP